MMKRLSTMLAAAIALPLAAPSETRAEETRAEQTALVARGEYLVNTAACHDCHTPFKMGDNGPEPDMTRMLSGHPEGIVIAEPATLASPWAAASSETNTAWSGPWGVSFTANLTPDPETGVLRDYSEAQFIAAMRTGRHLGMGRPILPPMPWPVYGQMTDDDLKAVYAYLRQIPAVKNKVPEPVAPVVQSN